MTWNLVCDNLNIIWKNIMIPIFSQVFFPSFGLWEWKQDAPFVEPVILLTLLHKKILTPTVFLHNNLLTEQYNYQFWNE